MNGDTAMVSPTTSPSKRIARGIPRNQASLVDGYPKELTEKFQPLYCALCDKKLSSNSAAYMHYNSKNHVKKVNNYLEEWSKRMGEPLPKKMCLGLDDDGIKLHCEACDLVLTSKQHAQQHYMGKQHQKVIAGKREPTGFGYYNKEGVWIRMDSKPDKTGRFGIGTGFLKQPVTDSDSKSANYCPTIKNDSLPAKISEDDLSKSAAELLKRADSLTCFYSDNNDEKNTEHTVAQDDGNTNTKITEIEKSNISLFCELCQIKVTSTPQMISHRNGSKHLKKMKQSGILQQDITPISGIVYPLPQPFYPIKKVATFDPSLDVTMFRTPTGSFYCKPCNLSINNELQFRTHIGSKKHKQKKNNYI